MTQRNLIGNFMSHFFNNMIAFEMLEKYIENTNIKYDNIILFRTDIVSDKIPFIENIEESTIYYPRDHIFNPSWINMAILIGDFEVMKIYCNLYKYIDEYINIHQVVLHSETLATYHLKKNDIIFEKINYQYELHADRREIKNIQT